MARATRRRTIPSMLLCFLAGQVLGCGETVGVVEADAAIRGGHDASVVERSQPLCSGCPDELEDRGDMGVHLHHVHLNVADRARSMGFYERFFGAQRVRLNGATDALRVAPTLLMFEETSGPINRLPTALQHVGFGSTDTVAWFEAAQAAGVEADTRGHTAFNTHAAPTVGAPGSGALIRLLAEPPECFPIPDVATYVYVLGPDGERIEVWSGVDDRVNHVHFTTADLAATAAWYQRFLGLPERVPVGTYAFFLDAILF